MTTNGPLVGGDMKMYYNSATFDLPTWVEMDEVMDVNIAEWDTAAAEVVTRAGMYAANLPAKQRAAVEAGYLYGANKTVFDFLRAAKVGRTNIDLAVCDGDIGNDCEGLRLQTFIENFPINEPVEEAASVDTIRFANHLQYDGSDVRIEPTWIIVTGGTIGAKALESSKLRLPESVLERLVAKRQIAFLDRAVAMAAKEAKANYTADPYLAIHAVPDDMIVYCSAKQRYATREDLTSKS